MFYLRATPYRAVENAISGGLRPTFGNTDASSYALSNSKDGTVSVF
jgi:hypothetical protein